MDLEIFKGTDKARYPYLRILDAITEAIQRGSLAPGERLPPHRTLARELGVALGTVTRAYDAAERSGLIVSYVGRGTFVALAPNLRSDTETPDGQPIDLTSNRLWTNAHEVSTLVDKLTALDGRELQSRLANYDSSQGHAGHREAGARWLTRKGVPAKPERIVICNGIQNGLWMILTALGKPGDIAVTEEFNYPGLKLLEGMLRLTICGLRMDQHGICPDALERAAKELKPKFLICTPTVHNPTNITMPDDRRESIAAIAKKHNLWIIELDEINGLFPIAPHTSVCELAPDRTVFLTSTWKMSEMGAAVGYILSPVNAVRQLSATLQATTWMPSPLLPEIVSSWIDDGTMENTLAWHQEEAAIRQRISSEIFGDITGQPVLRSYNVWLSLPEPWRSEAFADQATKRGVIVSPAEGFAVGRARAPHAVRVNLGGVQSRDTLRCGLKILATELLERPMLERVVA